MQPIMFLALFVVVFQGAMAVNTDVQKGIVDRFHSLPMASLAFLNGHVVSSLLWNDVSLVVVFCLESPSGFARTPTCRTGWQASVSWHCSH